jgi:ElaB/YqjD/DUF883 family membrane-anchored ribosome-binding protein
MSTEDTVYSATNELRQRLTDLEQDIQALGKTVRAAAAEKVHEVRDDAAAFCAERRAKAADVERVIEQRIVEQPLMALLTAAGIGFVLGSLWMRR